MPWINKFLTKTQMLKIGKGASSAPNLCTDLGLKWVEIMKILVRLIATRRAQIKVRAPEKRQKQRRARTFGKL